MPRNERPAEPPAKYGIWARDLSDWIRGPWVGDGKRYAMGFTSKKDAMKFVRDGGCRDTCEVRIFSAAGA